MLDDVAVVGERRLDDDLVVHLAVQSEARVPHVAQRVGEVALQVHSVQRGGWGRDTGEAQEINKRRRGGGMDSITNPFCLSTVTFFDAPH